MANRTLVLEQAMSSDTALHMQQHIVQRRKGANVTFGAGGVVTNLDFPMRTTNANKVAVRWTDFSNEVTMHFRGPAIAKRVHDSFKSGRVSCTAKTRLIQGS